MVDNEKELLNVRLPYRYNIMGIPNIRMTMYSQRHQYELLKRYLKDKMIYFQCWFNELGKFIFQIRKCVYSNVVY